MICLLLIPILLYRKVKSFSKGPATVVSAWPKPWLHSTALPAPAESISHCPPKSLFSGPWILSQQFLPHTVVLEVHPLPSSERVQTSATVRS